MMIKVQLGVLLPRPKGPLPRLMDRSEKRLVKSLVGMCSLYRRTVPTSIPTANYDPATCEAPPEEYRNAIDVLARLHSQGHSIGRVPVIVGADICSRLKVSYKS